MAFGVSQIRNDYLDKRYRDMVPVAREHDVKLKIMNELETKLDNIDNFGLTTAFNNLKQAMERVSLSQPDAREMTSQVRNQVVNICRMLSGYHAELTRMLEANVEELQVSVRATNNLIDKIVQYNTAITREYISDAGRIMRGQGVSEYGPLELLDQRNLLLDELAMYGNIEVFQNNNGSVRVTMAGVTIIDDEWSDKIVMQNFDDYGAAVLNFTNGVHFAPTSGELKAFKDMVNGNGPYASGLFQNGEFGIPYYIHALDIFAAGFAELMNQSNHGDIEDVNQFNRSLLWAGYERDEDGNIRTNLAGEPVRARIGAATIQVSQEWMDNELLIGETFLQNAIANYSIGTHIQGRVFMDTSTSPPSYFLVNNGTFDASAGDTIAGALTAGTISQISVHPHNPASPLTNWSNTRVNYQEGNIFVDPQTHVVYRVNTTQTTAITNLNDARTAVPPIITAIGVNEGGWQRANLDGANLSRFVRALEDSDRAWGTALDFNGNAFEYLMFLSDRLATGLDFVDKQFRVAMDTVNTLLDNRDAVSGVSETEEGINMLTYQKWFNASARLMTTMDEALDTIINRMGIVGR
jgi:flagellar hook-associated protein FlgK